MKFPTYLNNEKISFIHEHSRFVPEELWRYKIFQWFFLSTFFQKCFVCVCLWNDTWFFSHKWRCFEKNGCDKHLGVCLCCQRPTDSFNVKWVLVWEKWFLQTECIKILQLYSENDNFDVYQIITLFWDNSRTCL